MRLVRYDRHGLSILPHLGHACCLDDETVEDSSDGENSGRSLSGTAELPSPAVPFVEILSATNSATIMSQNVTEC